MRTFMHAALTLALTLVALPAIADDPELPNHALTPGAVRTTDLAVICRGGYTRTLRHDLVPGGTAAEERRAERDLRDAVYARYGMRDARGQHEVDHLVSLELGGSNDITNLWPQPYHAAWNAYVKDHLENRMHELACTRQVDLRVLQYEIATNWIAAYRKYIAPEPQGEDGHYDRASFDR